MNWNWIDLCLKLRTEHECNLLNLFKRPFTRINPHMGLTMDKIGQSKSLGTQENCCLTLNLIRESSKVSWPAVQLSCLHNGLKLNWPLFLALYWTWIEPFELSTAPSLWIRLTRVNLRSQRFSPPSRQVLFYQKVRLKCISVPTC